MLVQHTSHSSKTLEKLLKSTTERIIGINTLCVHIVDIMILLKIMSNIFYALIRNDLQIKYSVGTKGNRTL